MLEIQKRKIESVFPQEENEDFHHDFDEERQLLNDKLTISCSTSESEHLSTRMKKNVKELKCLESEYVLVNSIFGDMSSILVQQKQYLNETCSNLDSILDNGEKANQELKQTVEMTSKSSFFGKLILILFFVLFVFLSVLLGIK